MNKFEVGQRVRLKAVAQGWSNISTKVIYVVVDANHPFVHLHQKGQVSIYTVNGFPEDFEVVKYQGMKFKTPTPEISKEVQLALFELGYTWKISGLTVSNTGQSYLYTCHEGIITHGSFETYYTNDSRVEFEVKAKTTYEFLAVEKAPAETVELNGKTYLKADLEAALEKLKPL